MATGVVAMDTTPPSGDVSSVSGRSDAAPLQEQEVGQDSQTGQTGFEEQAQPVEPVQPSFGGPAEEQSQTPQEQSLGLTATNLDLAQVLPPAAAVAGTVATGGGYSGAESANLSSVVPSAPPPAYDEAAGYGTRTAHDGAAMSTQTQSVAGQPVGGIPGDYNSAYQSPYEQQQMQAPPPGSAYFPPSFAPPPQGPYNYQYGAPPPPTGGAVQPPYGQQFSNPASPHSYGSTATWGSFDTGSSDVQSQQEPFVPYVDRSTKPSSLNALSTCWGGEVMSTKYFYMYVYIVKQLMWSNSRLSNYYCNHLPGIVLPFNHK